VDALIDSMCRHCIVKHDQPRHEHKVNLLDAVRSYMKNVDTGVDKRTGIAKMTKQEAELLADPRLAELLDPVAFQAQVKRAAAKEGEAARKRFGPTSPNTPGFKQPKMPGT